MNRILATAFACLVALLLMSPSGARAANYAVGQRLECDPMGLHKFYKPGVVIAPHPGETYNGYAAGSGYFYRVRIEGGPVEGSLCKSEDIRPIQGQQASAATPANLPVGQPARPVQVAQTPSGDRFGARQPRKCAAQKTQPNVEQIKALIQCADEGQSNRDYRYLDENLTIQAGASRRFIEFSDSGSTGIDTTAPVIPIRGSVDAYQCAPLSKYTNVGTTYDTDNTGKNCTISPVRNVSGTCYRTTLGDWQCHLPESMSGTLGLYNRPPPPR